MAFAVKLAARLLLFPPEGGLITTPQASLNAADRLVAPPQGFRRWTSTRPVSRPSRQPATEPPGSYPDGTHTRWQPRAYVGSRSKYRPPTLGTQPKSSKQLILLSQESKAPEVTRHGASRSTRGGAHLWRLARPVPRRSVRAAFSDRGCNSGPTARAASRRGARGQALEQLGELAALGASIDQRRSRQSPDSMCWS
jgi:hypothetical protein